MSGPAFGDWVAIAYGKPHAEWARVGGARLARDPTEGEPVNGWVNRTIAYRRDGVDRWQAPAETLALRTGDCEDLAILKRAILIARGCPPASAFIVVGHDLALRQVHAVLLVGASVLDNTTDRVLGPAELDGMFTPLFAYGTTSWLYGRPLAPSTHRSSAGGPPPP